MSKFFIRLLGFILLLSTMGLATCQSMVKADPAETLPNPAQALKPGVR
ncbi:MAG: hypothetical protein PHH11_05170 [Methylomonas sp.]|nr:hypothetical protein [Methylomonas sp.]